MHTYISLLRGINVGNRNKIPMYALQDIYQTLGGTHVTTYIQSGNVVFRAFNGAATLEKSISQALQQAFNVIIQVMVREVAFFSEILTNNPFTGCDPNSLHVTLLGDTTGLVRLATLEKTTKGQDTFVVQTNAVYVHCPQGYGRTALNNSFFEANAKTWATTRNWRTINKVVALAHEIDSKTPI